MGKIPQSLFKKNNGGEKMATTKIWKVESRIDNAINYIKNKDKTKMNVTNLEWINLKMLEMF